jgi:hypothetical protein
MPQAPTHFPSSTPQPNSKCLHYAPSCWVSASQLFSNSLPQFPLPQVQQQTVLFPPEPLQLQLSPSAEVSLLLSHLLTFTPLTSITDATELPTTNLTLQYVAIGRGVSLILILNYCFFSYGICLRSCKRAIPVCLGSQALSSVIFFENLRC